MNVVPINKMSDITIPKTDLAPTDPWRAASAQSRHNAMLREQFIKPMLNMMAENVSVNAAIRNVLQHCESGNYSPGYIDAGKKLGRKGKMPSRATIHNWIQKFLAEGKTGLLDKYTGRVRKDKGWEHIAIQLYNIPSKPSFAAVAKRLRNQYQFGDVTDTQVRSYLQSLPAQLNEDSKLRHGKKFHSLNKGKYIERDTSVLQVGEVYQGDGHTCDCYIQHPQVSTRLYRPELTVWIDVRSRYIVGHYFSHAESSESTLFALSKSLLAHNHVPSFVHVDNGAGYKSRMMSDESTGFYQKFDITPIYALPGNSKGKGLVEGWFKIFRDNHDKFFNDGQDYCGSDMAHELNRQIHLQVANGKRQLKTFAEYRDSVAQYIDEYNHEPSKTLGGQSPADVWGELKNVPVEMSEAAVIRPRAERKVRRMRVRIDNRKYSHPNFANYNNRKIPVIVEYDLLDDRQVWVYDEKMQLICIAPLATKAPWLDQSRLEDKRKQREKNRIARKKRDIEIIKAEEARQIDHVAEIETLNELTGGLVIEHQSDDQDDGLALTLELIANHNDEQDQED